MSGSSAALRSVVSVRLDVGAAAGEEQPVEACDNLIGKLDIAKSRDHKRDTVRRLAQTIDVFASNPVCGLAFELDTTGGYADDG